MSVQNLPAIVSATAIAALNALRRAGNRAAQDALRTNTLMVVTDEDGKIENVNPHDYLRERHKDHPPSNGNV